MIRSCVVMLIIRLLYLRVLTSRWLGSMGLAFGLVARNPYQTFSQKVSYLANTPTVTDQADRLSWFKLECMLRVCVKPFMGDKVLPVSSPPSEPSGSSDLMIRFDSRHSSHFRSGSRHSDFGRGAPSVQDGSFMGGYSR